MSGMASTPVSDGGQTATPDEHLKTQLDFLWKVHDYTNNHIRFADTKAALVIAFASGFIASLVAHNIHYPIRNARFGPPFDFKVTLVVFSSIAAFSLLGASVLTAIQAILPRLWLDPLMHRNLREKLVYAARWIKDLFVPRSGTPTEPIYWESILAYGSKSGYRVAIQALNIAEQVQSVADHVFVLAGISDRKFRLVNRSIFFAVVGAFVASLLIVFAAALEP